MHSETEKYISSRIQELRNLFQGLVRETSLKRGEGVAGKFTSWHWANIFLSSTLHKVPWPPKSHDTCHELNCPHKILSTCRVALQCLPGSQGSGSQVHIFLPWLCAAAKELLKLLQVIWIILPMLSCNTISISSSHDFISNNTFRATRTGNIWASKMIMPTRNQSLAYLQPLHTKPATKKLQKHQHLEMILHLSTPPG